MKKIIPVLCAATIASVSVSPYVQAATAKGNGATSETKGIKQVETLTLEDVVEKGIENNKNVIVLQLNVEATNKQLLNTKWDKRNAICDMKELENKLDELKAQGEKLEDANLKAANEQEMAAIADSIAVLKDQVQALQLAIKQLELGKIQLYLQKEEAKEGVRLLLTSSYTNILLLQEQIDVTKKAVKSATADIKKAQRMYEIGTGSREAIRQVQAAETNLKKQVEEVEKKYNQGVANLCFDSGVVYHPPIVLEPIEYTASKSQKPASYSDLIHNSYKVKKAKKDLEKVILNRDDAYREYKENDNVGDKISIYELRQHDYEVKAAEETVALTKDEVEKALDQLYNNDELSYFAYEEALRKAEDIKQDLRALQVRYKLGFISKHDYDSALVQLDQANLNLYTANMQNYLAQQSIKASEAGYIQ